MQMCSGLTENKEWSPEFVGSSGGGAAEASKCLGPQVGPFPSAASFSCIVRLLVLSFPVG